MNKLSLTQRIEELGLPNLGRKIVTTAKLDEIADRGNFIPVVFYHQEDERPETLEMGELFWYTGMLSSQYVPRVIELQLRQRPLAQQDLAAAMKIAPSTLSMLLNGSRSFTIRSLEKSAEALEFIPSYLVPKRTGMLPFELQRGPFDTALQTLNAYLKAYLADDAYTLPLHELREVISCGERISDATGTLKVLYDSLVRKKLT